jgi:hypothetical protein
MAARVFSHHSEISVSSFSHHPCDWRPLQLDLSIVSRVAVEFLCSWEWAGVVVVAVVPAFQAPPRRPGPDLSRFARRPPRLLATIRNTSRPSYLVAAISPKMPVAMEDGCAVAASCCRGAIGPWSINDVVYHSRASKPRQFQSLRGQTTSRRRSS